MKIPGIVILSLLGIGFTAAALQNPPKGAAKMSAADKAALLGRVSKEFDRLFPSGQADRASLREELVKSYSASVPLDKAIEMLDKNRNGFITKDEFLTFLRARLAEV